MKALFFDLDDTLLNSKKVISERNRKAIIQCKNEGMLIGYITARSPRKMKVFLDNLPCDSIAYYNGAMVYADGILLANNSIPYTDAINFMKEVYQVAPDINMNCYLEPYCYREHKVINMVTNENLGEGMMYLPQFDFQRIRIVLSGYEKVNFAQYVTQSMKYLETIHNNALVTSMNATKENALRLLMNHYQITADNVISFGDDTNDSEMLRLSGTGVAMGNAIQEVKEAADYVTLTNDEDGVAEFIEKFILK